MKQDQLRSLAAELSRTEERERKWLAAELHDNLAQMLALCNMKFGTVKADLKGVRSSKTANEIQSLLDEALTYTRTLMSDLRPPLLGDEHDLPSAISWVTQKMQRRGLLVMLQDDGKLKVLDDEVLAVTYRSIQELLFNVLKHARSKKAAVSLQRSGEYLEAVVRDQGVGFDVAAGRTSSQEGAFGLLNIRERLEPLGGRLEITSALGEGTCAKVIVPLKAGTYPTDWLDQRESASPIEMAGNLDRSAKAAGSKIRVLLVDDHRIMREGLRRIIEEQTDLEIVGEAADGGMAVEVTRRLYPDVIIMDVNMPKMNGLEATRQIKAELPQITVIALSMHEDEKMAASMLAAGASAYLSKGGTFEMLCATIRKMKAQECNF